MVGEVLVDQRGVGQGPQVLGRLQFGGIGREKEQVHVVWDPEADAGMPAGPIQHEDDLLGGTGSHLTGKLGQLHFKHGNADGGGQMKECASRGGMDEAHQIPPGKAVLHGGDGPLANGRPDPPQERFEADAMFVSRPQLHLGVGKRRHHCLQQRSYFFSRAAKPA